MTWLLVMLGAAVGAPCRWLTDQWIQSRHDSLFPLGTLLVNVVGSLLLGGILAADAAAALPGNWVALLGAGLCGGFTTFSTFAYETMRLFEQGSTVIALTNVAASLALGMTAAVFGWSVVLAILGGGVSG